jgi:hypothetical protein
MEIAQSALESGREMHDRLAEFVVDDLDIVPG